MHIASTAATFPERVAIDMAYSSEVLTYGQLAARIGQLGRAFFAMGLSPGDNVAILIENQIRFIEVCAAAHSCGLTYTTLSTHLSAEEVEYILTDSDSRVLITSLQLAALAEQVAIKAPRVKYKLMLDGVVSGFQSYEDAVSRQPPEPLETELEGSALLYSSGTTGRPKGILLKPVMPSAGASLSPFDVAQQFGIDAETRFLLPGPMYHVSPLFYADIVLRAGGRIVIMERFDAEYALATIEDRRITHSFFVPTMLVRMLKLPESTRGSFDLSSHIWSMHGAAPCPIEVKRAMLEWWGPIIWEGYAGSERNGMTVIGPEEWCAHPGSVGRPVGFEVLIKDELGNNLSAGQEGLVYFRGGGDFEYHNDPVKTAASHSSDGASTIGDIGYLDNDGYLYLTDRSANMIITGGVNVYPQETENTLIGHDAVADVAVLGMPDPDMGQRVVAFIQLAENVTMSDSLKRELIQFTRDRISKIKSPREVRFVRSLPRLPNGKLLKRRLLESISEDEDA